MYARWNPGAGDRNGWFRVGEIEVTTTTLLVGLGVVSMVLWAIYPPLLDPLYFAAPLVREGEVWRIVTWPLAEPPSIWGVIGLAFFWFVGHMVEDRTTRSRYALLILAMTVIPAALVSLTPLTAETGIQGGLSLFGLGFLVVIAVDDPKRPWFFGIPLAAITAVFVGISALTYLGLRAWGALAMLGGVIGVALVGCAALGVITQLAFVPRLGEARGPTTRGTRGRRRLGGSRRKGTGTGTVTQGPWGSSPAAGGGKGPSPLEQAELDVLLDKIGQSGIDSLSKVERTRLDELSRRMRDS